MNNEDIKATLIKNLQTINHVLVLEETNSRQTIVLEEANYSLGRDPRNSILIASKRVSRFHATLLRRTDARRNSFSYWILDGDLQGNRSSNGILINEKRCLVQELKHEDVIQLGYDVKISYYIMSNVSDLMLLKSEDFEAKDSQKISKMGTKFNKSTLIISEPNVDKEEMNSPELQKLASFPELSPNPIIEVDWEGNITYLNPAANYKFRELQKTAINHPLLVGLIKNAKNQSNKNKLFVREVKIGDQVFEQYIHYLADKKLIRSYIFDFTKRKQLEAQLRESEQRYRTVLNQTQEGIFLVDADNQKILEANNAFCDLLGYDLDEIYTFNLANIIRLDSIVLDQEIKNFLENKTNVIQEYTFCKNDKSLIKLESNIIGINYGDQKIICFTVREKNQVRSTQTLIQSEGLYDLLTGLPNRNLFMEQLSTAIANNQRNPKLLCIIFLELEELNENKQTDNYAKQALLLEGFAKRLRSSLRSGDTVARWEYNRFITLLPEVRTFKDIGKISGRILDALKPPFFLDKQKIYIKTSMGIVVSEEDGDNVEILLDNAEKALNESKLKRTNNYLFYNTKIHQEIERLLRLEKLLFNALERQEFLVYYQPQFNIKTKRITGLEAILRWQHSELGFIASEQFIPLAEETGLIVPISEWLLETICHQHKVWQKNNLGDFPITVNLSSQQFQQPNLVAFIKSILTEINLEPHFLELEINEKNLIENIDLASKVIPEINELGTRICLDNFGSGMCALGYLKQFNFQSFKIDKLLIKNLPDHTKDLAIVSALINLGHSFEIRTIAQGVETQEQLKLLSNLGCQEFQGNLFTEALDTQNIDNFLRNPKYNF